MDESPTERTGYRYVTFLQVTLEVTVVVPFLPTVFLLPSVTTFVSTCLFDFAVNSFDSFTFVSISSFAPQAFVLVFFSSWDVCNCFKPLPPPCLVGRASACSSVSSDFFLFKPRFFGLGTARAVSCDSFLPRFGSSGSDCLSINLLLGAMAASLRAEAGARETTENCFL